MDKQINDLVVSLTNNKNMLSVMVTLFLALFGGMAAPALPSEFANLFTNQYFNMLVLTLISYGTNSDIRLSAIVSILFYSVISKMN